MKTMIPNMKKQPLNHYIDVNNMTKPIPGHIGLKCFCQNVETKATLIFAPIFLIPNFVSPRIQIS